MPTLKKHNFQLSRSRLIEENTKKQGKFCEIYNLANDCYKGEWKNDKKHGIGELRASNGYLYLGQWKNNKKHGYGMLKKYNEDKNEYELIYEGEWEKDLQHGHGIGFFPDGSYNEGEYKFGKKNGYGIMTFSSGSHYSGEWLNDQMHGFGIWTNPNGSYYEGHFKNGKCDGRGQFVMPARKCLLRGVWRDDLYFSGESLPMEKNV